MIKVFLRGGLGNQMFQYALGLNLAKKQNTDLVLDATFLNDRFPRPNFVYRNYESGCFRYHAPVHKNFGVFINNANPRRMARH